MQRAKFKNLERSYFQEKLAQHINKIKEANLIAQELKRNVQFEIKLGYTFSSISEINIYNDPEESKYKIKVKVDNKEEGEVYYWDIDKFIDRYYIFKDLLEEYYESHKEDFTIPEKVQFSRILVKIKKDRDEVASKTQAKRIRAKLTKNPSPKSFEGLAEKHSDGPYKRRGGDVGP